MFNFFKKIDEPKNLKETLIKLRKLEKNLEKVSQELEILKKENKFAIQKVSIVRFNPFSEIGSDQSFSIALLDGKDDGLIITSLYTREGNRVYGKEIKNNESKHLLSKEEEKVIQIAKYGNKNSKSNSEKKQSSCEAGN